MRSRGFRAGLSEKSRAFELYGCVHGEGGEEEKYKEERERERQGGSRQVEKKGSGTCQFTSLPLPTLFH